jgi:hypothetical protein
MPWNLTRDDNDTKEARHPPLTPSGF